MSKQRLVCCMWLLLGTLPAQGELQPTAAGSIDYGAGRVVVTVETPVPRDVQPFPAARLEAVRVTERELPGFVLRTVLDLQVDSLHRLTDLVQNDPALFTAVQTWAEGGPVSSALAPELGALVAIARPTLLGPGSLISFLVTHQQPNPPPRILGFEPSRAYTGLVIYAADRYRATGKPGQVAVRPALFPRILNEELQVVVEARMMEPGSVYSWGTVAYSDSLAEGAFVDRIGEQPLRTMARGVFGRDDTDIVIPTAATRALLATADNHRVIREGRILVILASTTVLAGSDGAEQ